MLTATHTIVSTEVRERSLIERLRDGDPGAFEAMVRRYGTQMLAVARRLVRNEDDAREVVQEAFLQAFRALDDFRADAKLSTWLHRIVVNTGLMRLRSASRRPEGFIDDLLPDFDTTGHHANPVTPIPMTVEDAIEHQEIRVRQWHEMRQLDCQRMGRLCRFRSRAVVMNGRSYRCPNFRWLNAEVGPSG